MSFIFILTSTYSSNDVQVKRSRSIAWIFAYRIKCDMPWRILCLPKSM